MLTSSVQGAICPGKVVTLTCILTGVSLEWNSPTFSRTIRYIGNEHLGGMVERGNFTATLISVVPNPTLTRLEFTSTLRVNVTPKAGTVITCTDQLNPMSVNLTLAGTSLPASSYPPNHFHAIFIHSQELPRNLA